MSRVTDRPPAPDATIVADWFDRHVDALHAYASRRVGHDVARDVVSETFRVALQRVDRFDPDRGDERAWLFGIATNVVRRHWRTELRHLDLQTRATRRDPRPAIDPLLDVDDAIDSSRRFAPLLEGFARLDPEDRDILVLTAWEQMTSAEVGAVLGLPAGTVRSRLHRIRRELGRTDLTAIVTSDPGDHHG